MSRPINVQFIAGPDGRPAYAVLPVEEYYGLLEGVGAPARSATPPAYEPGYEPRGMPPLPPGVGAEFEMPPPPPQPERPPMPDHVRARIDAAPELAAAWGDMFESDWALAAGEDPPAPVTSAAAFPVRLGDTDVSPAFSPRDLLNDPGYWDLPQLVAAIDTATSDVSLQALTVKPFSGRGGPLTELTDALERAAARGVQVRVLTSHWNTSSRSIGDLRELSARPGHEVRVIELPVLALHDDLAVRIQAQGGSWLVDDVLLGLEPAAADCPADLSEPFGSLDFADVLAFLSAFGAGEPEADLSEVFAKAGLV